MIGGLGNRGGSVNNQRERREGLVMGLGTDMAPTELRCGRVLRGPGQLCSCHLYPRLNPERRGSMGDIVRLRSTSALFDTFERVGTEIHQRHELGGGRTLMKRQRMIQFGYSTACFSCLRRI